MATESPARKVRIQSKVDKLPELQRQQLFAWMREGLIYSELARRVRANFGVSIAESSLSTYHGKHSREIHGQQTPGVAQTVHVHLVLHVQIRPELIQQPAHSDG